MILEIIKENYVIIGFFLLNFLIVFGFFFISNIQDSLNKELKDEIDNRIEMLQKASGKIKKVKGKNIRIEKKKDKILKISDILSYTFKVLGKSNINIIITKKQININKIFVGDINYTGLETFLGNLFEKGYKIEVLSYPNSFLKKLVFNIKL